MTGVAIQKYLEPAINVLKSVGLDVTKTNESQLVQILDDVRIVDEPKILAIAQTIRYMGPFNDLVRDKTKGMNVDDRYGDITSAFDSIREDSRTLVEQLADGKIDFKEKAANVWMKLTRGTPVQRFEKIRSVYLDVSGDTKKQLDAEGEIIDAYQNFRSALKGAEILAKQVLEKQVLDMTSLKGRLDEATTSFETYTGEDSKKAELQLARDEVKREMQLADRNYQLLKNLSEDLSNSYNVGEALVAKLVETHSIKEQVYNRSVSFFTTNENVFSAMAAVYTSQQGLHESTQTLEAMKDGVNKSLEDIAVIGGDLEKAALKAGYGSTYNPESVKKLVDSIIAYQEEHGTLVAQYRKESTLATKQIEGIVEDGKRRSKEIADKYFATAVQEL